MFIINTLLEGGDIEDAMTKAMVMNSNRPSHLPPQGFLVAMLTGVDNIKPEMQGVIDVCAIEGGRTS